MTALLPLLAAASLLAGQPEPAPSTVVSLVAIDEADGGTEFRATIVTFGGQGRGQCAINMVLWDHRADPDGDAYPGVVRRVAEDWTRQGDGSLKIQMPILPNHADGILTITLNTDDSTGRWQMETIDGINGQGSCLLWKPVLGPESPCAKAGSPSELLTLWNKPAE